MKRAWHKGLCWSIEMLLGIERTGDRYEVSWMSRLRLAVCWRWRRRLSWMWLARAAPMPFLRAWIHGKAYVLFLVRTKDISLPRRNHGWRRHSAQGRGIQSMDYLQAMPTAFVRSWSGNTHLSQVPSGYVLGTAQRIYGLCRVFAGRSAAGCVLLICVLDRMKECSVLMILLALA